MLMKGIPEPIDSAASARLLVHQVRALQRAHRAGINPHYGQLENLFEMADVLDRQLQADEDRSLPIACSTPECRKPSIRPIGDGQGLCIDCAARAIAAALFEAPAAVGA